MRSLWEIYFLYYSIKHTGTHTNTVPASIEWEFVLLLTFEVDITTPYTLMFIDIRPWTCTTSLSLPLADHKGLIVYSQMMIKKTTLTDKVFTPTQWEFILLVTFDMDITTTCTLMLFDRDHCCVKHHHVCHLLIMKGWLFIAKWW